MFRPPLAALCRAAGRLGADPRRNEEWSYWLPPPPAPPAPPPPVCGVARAGCSALLEPEELFDRVSAPVAAPAPTGGDTVPVAPGPELAVPGDALGGEDEAAPVWAKAGAAVKSATAVKRAIFVMAVSLAVADVSGPPDALSGQDRLSENGAGRGEVPGAGRFGFSRQESGSLGPDLPRLPQHDVAVTFAHATRARSGTAAASTTN